uniref:Uncharacterized protein n=1 Tax=Tanacetum cinerariifolium TaxID=118510 RepID=A0A699GGW8_TANCI|nr:hypothetical protein [Tanacetum cinerariifolium]
MTNVDQGASKKQNASQLSGFEQEEEDAHVTLTPVLDTQKTGGPTQSFYVSSNFTSKLLNFDNQSLANNEIASLMDITAHHATAFLKSHQVSLNLLLHHLHSSILYHNKVTNLEKDILEMKQVKQYVKALSSIYAILDRYIDNKLREAINKEVNTQLSQILPQAISDVTTLVIEKNVTESLEVVVLTRSSSQPWSSYETTATLSEFELTKILIDKIEKNKSFDIADYKRELYDALVKPYNTDKDIFESYDRETKKGSQTRKLNHPEIQGQRKRSLQVSLKTPLNLNISLSESLPMQRSQVILLKTQACNKIKSSSHKRMIPTDKEVTKAGWFKKPKRPPSPDPDWSKRQQVNFRPPQTWISQFTCTEEPPTSFDELNDTSFDFSAFVMNRLKIPNLTKKFLLDRHSTCSKYRRKRLLRTDEPHKFSDGTLNDVRSALHDIAAGIRMEYLPMRK